MTESIEDVGSVCSAELTTTVASPTLEWKTEDGKRRTIHEDPE